MRSLYNMMSVLAFILLVGGTRMWAAGKDMIVLTEQLLQCSENDHATTTHR